MACVDPPQRAEDGRRPDKGSELCSVPDAPRTSSQRLLPSQLLPVVGCPAILSSTRIMPPRRNHGSITLALTSAHGTIDEPSISCCRGDSSYGRVTESRFSSYSLPSHVLLARDSMAVDRDHVAVAGFSRRLKVVFPSHIRSQRKLYSLSLSFQFEDFIEHHCRRIDSEQGKRYLVQQRRVLGLCFHDNP